jgi:hypothetical protein
MLITVTGRPGNNTLFGTNDDGADAAAPVECA